MGLLPSSAIHRVVASNVQRIRKERGFTQAILAETARINQTHVGNIENARNSPSLEILDRLALALEVPITVLLGDKENQLNTSNSGNNEASPLDRLNLLLPYVRQYQRLASEFGIVDIFQDSGGKLLQTLIITRLRNLPGSTGNDAQDEQGNEYELKTVNRSLTAAFSTHHHLSPAILARYRQVNWLFCVYDGIEVVELYLVRPQALEPYFSAWETRWQRTDEGGKRALNNPKIPIKFVHKVGRLIYKEVADGKISSSPELAHWFADGSLPD